MKTKKILLISACAMALGLLLAAAGYFNGASLAVNVGGRGGVHITDRTPHTLAQESLSAFDSIDLNIEQGDVEFVPSDHYGVVITYYDSNQQYTSTVTNSTLNITETSGRFPFSLINFGIFTQDLEDTVKIYIPESTQFRNLKIQNQYGDFKAAGFTSHSTNIQLSFGQLDLSDFSCGSTSITLQNGEGNLKNISADSLTYQNDYGDSTFENITVTTDSKSKIEAQNGTVIIKKFNSGDLEINDDYGDVNLDAVTLSKLKSTMGNGSFTINNSTVADSEVKNSYGDINAAGLMSNGASIECQNGTISLSGTLKGNTTVHSDFGDATVRTSLPQEQYSYRISSELGDVTINGEKAARNTSQQVKTGDSITISSSAGSASLNFAG